MNVLSLVIQNIISSVLTFFFKKGSKQINEIMQLISKKICRIKSCFFLNAITCSLSELDEILNRIKISKV